MQLNREKWLVFDPAFLVTIGLMALFSYLFDSAFRGAVYLHPGLAFIYAFQYQLILPLINVALLSVLFYGARRLRVRRKVVSQRPLRTVISVPRRQPPPGRHLVHGQEEA